ncbi:MAG: hypothetical protein IANPNBLG_00891 [Bryobacteraceae bacterium]|nr:hypothetical protein [Bryobacteraceae bacterium]
MAGPVGGSAEEQSISTHMSESDRIRVGEQLTRVLESRAFEGSYRCQELLRHLVRKTLDGDSASLKERLIGAEVFGRDYGYDTSSDAIVRVKVNEIRKRLAQYYDQAGRDDTLRIHLPIGSYVPRFFVVEPFPVTEEAAPEPVLPPGVNAPARPAEVPGGRSKSRLWWPALIAVAALAVWMFWPHFTPRHPMDVFWEPFFKAGSPVVVCIPASNRIFLPEDVVRQMEDSARQPPGQINMALKIPDVRVVPNGQTSVQNIRATLSIATYLSRNRKPVQFGLASEISLEEIRRGRVVLIGGFRNPWADALNEQMRYKFETSLKGSHETSWISDSSAKGKLLWVVPDLWPFGRQTIDYAIISRFFDPSSGQTVIALSGLNGFGTQVAAEFLTDPKYWTRFEKLAPRGWDRKNCQIVLETKVIRELPGPPKVLAVHAW